MRIELVVVDECPHEEAAAALLTVAESQSVADELHFLGSPTFMVEGRDLLDEPGRPAALACRIYPEGQALPSLRDLGRALKEAAAAPAPR